MSMYQISAGLFPMLLVRQCILYIAWWHLVSVLITSEFCAYNVNAVFTVFTKVLLKWRLTWNLVPNLGLVFVCFQLTGSCEIVAECLLGRVYRPRPSFIYGNKFDLSLLYTHRVGYQFRCRAATRVSSNAKFTPYRGFLSILCILTHYQHQTFILLIPVYIR